MKQIDLPANSVKRNTLTPDLRRELGGSVTTAIVTNNISTTTADTQYYDIIAKVLIDTNISLTSQITNYDEVDLAVDEILLLNGQTDSVDNGIYLNKSTGLERLDFELVPGKPIFISHGAYKYTGWVLAVPTVTIGTSQIRFIQVFPFDDSFIRSQLGFMYLHLWDLWNAPAIYNSVRMDGFDLTADDIDHCLLGTHTWWKLYFNNEVLRGSKIFTQEDLTFTNDGVLSSGNATDFICEVPGIYDVSCSLFIELSFREYPISDDYIGMAGFRLKLYVTRQAKSAKEAYSILGQQYNYQYFFTSGAIQCDIDINPLVYSIVGYDTIKLEPGDRLHFELVPSGFQTIYGSSGINTTCVTCDSKGHFSIEYRNAGTEQVQTQSDT